MGVQTPCPPLDSPMPSITRSSVSRLFLRFDISVDCQRWRLQVHFDYITCFVADASFHNIFVIKRSEAVCLSKWHSFSRKHYILYYTVSYLSLITHLKKTSSNYPKARHSFVQVLKPDMIVSY